MAKKEQPLKITGTLDGVLRVAVTPKKTVKKAAPKKTKPKK